MSAGEEAEHGLKQRNVTTTFIVLGIVVIFPWNCILSATAYLDGEAFPDRDWPTYSTQVYQTVFLLAQVGMIMYGIHLGPRAQFLVPLIGCIVSIVVLMVGALGEGSTDVRFAVCLLATGFLGASMGIMQAALFGVAAQGIKHFGNLPGQIMVGMGLAGVGAFSLALLGQFLFQTARGAFITLFASVIVLSLVGGLLYGSFKRVNDLNALDSLQTNDALEMERQAVEASGEAEVWSNCRSIYAGLTYELAIFCVFAVTFIVFPAQCAQWKGTGALDSGSYTTFVFGDFQILDTVGRWSAENIRPLHRLGTPLPLWILTVLRAVFVPLFFLSASNADGVFGSQAFQLPLMAAFAASNGLVGSLAMQFAPKHVPAPARGTVGMAMTLSLVGGIACGSYLALI